jgi:DNA-binding MarR family transcriptional regulator
MLTSMLYIHYTNAMTAIDSPISEIVGEVTRECVMTRTRRVARVITNLYDSYLRPHGINAPQFSLLVMVAKMGSASRAEMGRANRQERSTLTRNLALLLEQGWVEEVVSERGRSRPIVVSQSGKALLEQAAPSWRTAQEKARQLLGEESIGTLLRMENNLAQTASSV